MVWPILAAKILGTGAGLYLLAGIVSHLVTPASLLAGGVVAIGVLLYLDRHEVLSPLQDERIIVVANVGVSLFFGFIAYRAAVWLLAGVTVTTALLVVIGVFVLGLPAFIALLQVLATRYVGR